MTKRWREVVEDLSGTGTLIDHDGIEAETDYSLRVERNFRERTSLTRPTEKVAGSFEPARGWVTVLNAFQAGLNLQSPRLILLLEDGRRIQGLLTRFGAPNELADFEGQFQEQLSGGD